MNLSDAYLKIFLDVYPGMISKQYAETSELYIFCPVNPLSDSDDVQMTGVIFPAINKRTGAVVEYNVLDHLGEHLDAKEVPSELYS